LSAPIIFVFCSLQVNAKNHGRVLISSRVNGGYPVNPSHMDLLLTLAGLGDVVGDLHPHERVHLHSKGFLNAERHIPGKVSLAVKQAR
jgi:hypothetical protein